jgi:hypothetical protein
MDHTITVYFVFALCMLTIAAGLNFVRRELLRKRRDNRMAQALRRGLLESQGIQMHRRARVIQWQPCETNSARCS